MLRSRYSTLRSALWLMVFALPLFFTAACGGGRATDQSWPVAAPAAPEAAADMAWGAFASEADAPGYAMRMSARQRLSGEWEEIAGTGERHIIQTADISMETEDFEDVVAELREIAPSVGGYVESETLRASAGRRFNIVLRVPAAAFDTALIQIQDLADVRSLTQSAEDVTDIFYDQAARLETRRIEEERILALISEADDLESLLDLERRLTSTRLAIEHYLHNLDTMAGRISFSTISVVLFDIHEDVLIAYAPTLGSRIGGAFGDSVDSTVRAAQNFIVFLAGAAIPLALIGLIALAVWQVRRIMLKKALFAGKSHST